MRDRWYANKFGLLNFWYYDEEEFKLSKGKLLFRGSNGSGKSVTMQSFVPFLLDGNKSPERLDPFGTRARRMENYLLDENNDERTAYLYIEFKKGDSDTYLTIGTGMKAVKNKPLDSWYFIINDGRRINKEFYLYEDMGEKIPLTKKQLQNRVEKGGFFTESQTKYMEKVNEHLFSYSDIENYEELINLLIQLRSPKLSKDFKPTEIYKILTSSLKTLSDEDLRPMSESMENMDSLRSTLEELSRSQRAAEQIKGKYHKLNSFMLYEKGEDYVKCNKKYKEFNKEKETLINSIKEKEKKLLNLRETLEKYASELLSAETKYSELQGKEVLQLKEKIIEIEKNIKGFQFEINKNTEKLSKLEIKERDKKGSIRKLEDEYDLKHNKVKDKLEELEELSLDFAFEEGKFLKDELLKDMEGYSFSFVKEVLCKYTDKLKDGISALENLEVEKTEYDKMQREKDSIERNLRDLELALKERNTLFTEEKDKLIGDLNKWNGENKELIIPKEVLQYTFKGILDFQNRTSEKFLLEKLSGEYTSKEAILKARKEFIKNHIKEINKNIDDIKSNIEELKIQKEVTIDRSQGVIKHRAYLEKENIPYIPLYKAIDFMKDVPEVVKIAVESALVDMGLIDALIINKEDYEKAVAMDEEQSDKYLQSKPNIMSYNLSKLLNIDEGELKGVKKEEVLNVLDSIFMDKGEGCFIDEKGHYHIGIMGGKASLKYNPKYIGASSRERHRQELIREKEEAIEGLKKEIELKENEVKIIESRINILVSEYKNIPKTEDLLVALNYIENISNSIEVTENKLIKINEEVFKQGEKVICLKQEVFNITEGIELKKDKETFKEGKERAEEYKDLLNEVEVILTNLRGIKEKLNMIKEELESIESEEEDLRYNLNLKERSINEEKNKKYSYEEVLSKSNIKEIEEEIDKCLEVKKNYPKLINDNKVEEGGLEANIKNENEKLKFTEEDILKFYEKLNCYGDILKKELELQYIKVEKNEDILKTAREVMSEGNIDVTKTKDDYNKELYDVFSKYNGDLREYNLKIIDIFGDLFKDYEEHEELGKICLKAKRIDLRCKLDGKEVQFNTLLKSIEDRTSEIQLLINEREREIFEEILINTISNKIRAKIHQGRLWVDKMNALFESMDTSSGLKFNLKWVPKKAENEEQLDINKLVDILGKGNISSEQDIKNLSQHFRQKLKETLRLYEGSSEERNYQTIIRDILDYRDWYEFKLSYIKTGENKKELTNNEFFKFSGGEKAMAMYLPIFAAVYARYEGATNKNCPRIIALDEAFAGVDENNIRDMFKKLRELDFDYVINSQVLWGDYDSVDDLAISEIIRDGNDEVITVIKYHWNGIERKCLV